MPWSRNRFNAVLDKTKREPYRISSVNVFVAINTLPNLNVLLGSKLFYYPTRKIHLLTALSTLLQKMRTKNKYIFLAFSIFTLLS